MSRDGTERFGLMRHLNEDEMVGELGRRGTAAAGSVWAEWPVSMAWILCVHPGSPDIRHAGNLL